MNLRDFCQLPNFPTAVLTTFNIDPLFFERVVLNDLVAGGASRVFVLADADQAMPQITAALGQLVSLGRRYRLIPVRLKGSFHPKLCVRIGPDQALVASGSHNLTRSGWLGRGSQDQSGGNRESTVAWQVSPGTTGAQELYANLKALISLIDFAGDRDELGGYLAGNWLKQAEQDAPLRSDISWVVSGTRASLSSVLERRWEGRRFEALHVVTGSTDQQGAMIRWAAETFGVTKAVVEVDRAFCSFDPSLLLGLPVDLRIKMYNGNPRTHLKAALFQSDGDCAAVVGSANCSGAAWLRTTEENGNIESVVIYDHCSSPEFAQLISIGSGRGVPAGRMWSCCLRRYWSVHQHRPRNCVCKNCNSSEASACSLRFLMFSPTASRRPHLDCSVKPAGPRTHRGSVGLARLRSELPWWT